MSFFFITDLQINKFFYTLFQIVCDDEFRYTLYFKFLTQLKIIDSENCLCISLPEIMAEPMNFSKGKREHIAHKNLFFI